VSGVELKLKISAAADTKTHEKGKNSHKSTKAQKTTKKGKIL
jgi:hypothetical protein